MYPRQVTLFNHIDLFKILYFDYQKLFKNMAVIHFESVCVQEGKFRDTETTTWIGKHVPISVSISSSLTDQPIFSCNSNTGALVESFVDAIDGLAAQNKALMKIKFLEVEFSVKSKLNQMFSFPNQRRCPKEPVLEFEDECIEEEEEQDVSTNFWQTQKNQLNDMRDHLKRICNVLPVFGFNSRKYTINLRKIELVNEELNQ